MKWIAASPLHQQASIHEWCRNDDITGVPPLHEEKSARQASGGTLQYTVLADVLSTESEGGMWMLGGGDGVCGGYL